MKVAFCIFKYFPFGGIQRDMMKMVAECRRRGHGVRIYAIHWRDDGPLPDGVELKLVPAKALANHRLYERFADWVRDDLKADPVGLLVGMNKMPGLDAYYAGDSCYQHKARTQRNAWYRLLPRYRSLLRSERAVFDAAADTEILTISDAETPIYQRCYQTPPKRLHALPPGIERNRTAPADRSAIRGRMRASLGVGEAECLLLFVGSGFIKKGLDRLLKGFKALPRELFARTWLYVLGDDNADPFQRLAGRLGIGERVYFMGGRPDVPDFLFAADAFVLPAYDENAGMAILEAMIAGTPALVTQNCGYARYLQQARAGLVTPMPYDQDTFNAQLVELITSDQRAEWARNGRALADDERIYQLAQRAVDLFERFAVHSQAITSGVRHGERETLSDKPKRAADGIEAEVKGKMGMVGTYLAPDLAERLGGKDLLRWAASAEGEMFRKVKGRSTWRVLIGGKPYFLKRHLGVGWREILKNWMVGKRPVLGAENECRACRHLAAIGLPAPRVVAFATEGGNPARRRSFVLCEELDGHDSLEAVAAQWVHEPPSPLAQRRLILAVARFVRRLHEAGVAHRDLYICHLMLDRQHWAQGEVRLAVLDLHRARLQPKLSAYWRKRDLAALLFSTLDLGLPARSQLRFLRIYTGRPLREVFAEDARLWRAVARRAQALHDKARRRGLG